MSKGGLDNVIRGNASNIFLASSFKRGYCCILVPLRERITLKPLIQNGFKLFSPIVRIRPVYFIVQFGYKYYAK